MTRMMKDSGVEWIGEIPENYKLVQVRQLFNIGRGRVIATTELEDSGYPVYSSQTKNDGLLGYIKTYDFDTNQLTWTTDGANAGTVFLREGKHNCTNVCGTLQSKTEKVSLSYMKYALGHIAFYHKRIDINGAKIMNNEMAAITTILPPLPEQQKIATFLDEKCGAIDEIISKTEQSIEEYKKLKQSVITKAVTKGIRPNRPMQDSNIEWIGEIPTDWSVIKLRYLYRCQNGISKSAEFFGKGFPFVSYKDVYNNDVLPETVSGLCNATEEELNRYSVKQGDIFFTRTSETIEEIGLTSICLNSFENATFAGFLIRCRPYTTKLDFEYSKYYMASSHLRLYFVKEMNLVTRASLSQELLKDLQVLIPPLEEQKEIAQYLDEKCAEIDTLVEKKQQFLAEMANYKKSLIYEYVTGKKEVA